MLRPLLILITLFAFTQTIHAGWDIDLSRRTKEIRQKEYTVPGNKKEEEGFLDAILATGEPVQEVVVLNTNKGFIPATLRVREGRLYKVHVVNVNETEKNVSFVLDAFSEHHATYYGIIKTFTIRPKKEGIYSFQSPETSAQGRLVVYPAVQQGQVDIRHPASE